MLKHKKALIALSIIPQYVLIKWLSHYPEFIETYYSNGIYPYISKIFRFMLGWLPFSFGDLIYAFGIVFIIRWFFINFTRIKTDTSNWFIDVFSAVSIVYFAFHLFWGINYYRLPLYKSLGLKSDYTTEQLVNVTKKLILISNKIHAEIIKNDTLPIAIPYSKSEILKL